MRLQRSFDVKRPADDVRDVLAREETLLGLFPEGSTEVLAREGDRTTVRTRYEVLGQEGVATFHFDRLMDGSVRFEKVCDGRVWKELIGDLGVEEDGGHARVTLDLRGATKAFVPEFTIKLPMQEQIEQMEEALRARLELEPT